MKLLDKTQQTSAETTISPKTIDHIMTIINHLPNESTAHLNILYHAVETIIKPLHHETPLVSTRRIKALLEQITKTIKHHPPTEQLSRMMIGLENLITIRNSQQNLTKDPEVRWAVAEFANTHYLNGMVNVKPTNPDNRDSNFKRSTKFYHDRR